MKGLEIHFNEGGAFLDLQSSVQGEWAQVQNIMVNISTSGPAPVFEERGTTLMYTMVTSGFVSNRRAQHLANFAALDSLFFCKTFNSESSVLTQIDLTAPIKPEEAFVLRVSFNGVTITSNLPI